MGEREKEMPFVFVHTWMMCARVDAYIFTLLPPTHACSHNSLLMKTSDVALRVKVIRISIWLVISGTLNYTRHMKFESAAPRNN